MNYNKYLIKKEKTDLLSSLKQVNKKIIKEELESKDLDNIRELKKYIIDDFEFCLEMSKDDKNTIAYFFNILKNENTNQMAIYDEDIESLWAFVYKNKDGYSYFIADEIKNIINEKLDIKDFKSEVTINEEEETDLHIYLDNISNKYLNELYNKLEFKEDKLSKKENVFLSINAKIIKTVVNLTNEDIEQIKQVISGNIPEKINDVLKDAYIFYDKYGDKKYFVSEEIKEMANNIDINDMENDKKVTYAVFYIEANGVIKIDRLIKIIKETAGISITKKEIKDILKKSDYYINNDIIFINKALFDSGIGIKLLEEKEKIPYITYSQIELILLSPIITSTVYFNKINNIVHKKIKDEIESEIVTELILTSVRMLVDYENEVLNVLKHSNIKLSNKDMEKLFDILEETSKVYPKWIFNGEMLEDFDFDDEYYDEENTFEELPEEEKLEIYISQYLAINGVIKLEKMLEILEYHNMKITKKELIKAIKNIEEIVICKEYICFKEMEGDIEQLLMIKSTSNFKLIEDVDQFVDEIEYNCKKIKDICSDYGISEENSEGVLAFMTYGILNKDFLNSFLMENNIILTKNLLDRLYKELSKASKDIRTWKYNGYTENEIRLQPKQRKQGRNELCSCGSGKKYKKCCGR